MKNVKEFKAQVSKEREIAMYGCEIADFKESLENSITFTCGAPALCAMSLMSDAQEEMADGNIKASRQTINRAKWILSEYCTDAQWER